MPLGPRLLAGLIDMVIVAAIVAGLISLVPVLPALRQLLTLVAVIMPLRYFVVAEGCTLTTPGKRLFGFVVVTLDGERPSSGDMLRGLTRVPEVLPLFLPYCLYIHFTQRHQRLGDMVSETVVVRRPGNKPAGTSGSHSRGPLLQCSLLQRMAPIQTPTNWRHHVGKPFRSRQRRREEPSCAACGRTLLAGEWTQRVVDEAGEDRLVCSLCGQASQGADGGLRRRRPHPSAPPGPARRALTRTPSGRPSRTRTPRSHACSRR